MKAAPKVKGNGHLKHFICEAFALLIDGKPTSEQLTSWLEEEIKVMEREHHQASGTLGKVADSLPGFGIVAAVLGIVITMGAISGPIEEIGHKVGAALVGTFLGIFISYGFLNPLAVNMEFVGAAETSFLRTIATCVASFAGGMAPLMAIEMGRRGLSSELKPTADELEAMLKGVTAGPK